jgi:hypothetical protein
MKCWNSPFNAQGSRLIILIVQVRAVKIYVAAVEALRKKERQDETQCTTKIDGFLNFRPFWMLMYVFCGLSDPAPTSAPSKKSRSAISWMGWNCPPRGQFTWSVICFFFWAFFPPDLTFFFYSYFLFSKSLLFSPGPPFDFIFSFSPPLTPILFLGTPTYPPPTYLKPFFLPTHQPPSFCPPLHSQCLRSMDNMGIWV